MWVQLYWRRGLVESSPPVTEETGAMGREIESRQGMYSVVALKNWAQLLKSDLKWVWFVEYFNELCNCNLCYPVSVAAAAKKQLLQR
jgi:hypothetical protein